jgi:predicted Zn-ribbon and HTH transcriptional regulator
MTAQYHPLTTSQSQYPVVQFERAEGIETLADGNASAQKEYCGWCGHHRNVGLDSHCPKCAGNSWLLCRFDCNHDEIQP